MSNRPCDTVSDEADRSAMERLRDGDDLALNDLMERWRRPILAYLYRTVCDYETAADLSQEVFVRLYRSRRKYRAKNSFSSYLFTIAANLAKNHFRWKRRHPETELSDSISNQSSAADLSSREPSSNLETAEAIDAIQAAVQSLPEKLRTPVILSHYNGLPQSEIAKILNCSEKAVETRLYRARKSMRHFLESQA